jgi:hypothetical protein
LLQGVLWEEDGKGRRVGLCGTLWGFWVGRVVSIPVFLCACVADEDVCMGRRKTAD